MSSELFQVELIGGPKDGHCQGVAFVPGDTMRMPATRGVSTPARPSAVAEHASHYDLACVHVGRDSSGLPLVRLRYEFVGTEKVQPVSRFTRVIRGLLEALGMSSFVRALPNLRRKFAAWMMAPIDYPRKNMAAPLPRVSRVHSAKGADASLESHDHGHH